MMKFKNKAILPDGTSVDASTGEAATDHSAAIANAKKLLSELDGAIKRSSKLEQEQEEAQRQRERQKSRGCGCGW